MERVVSGMLILAGFIHLLPIPGVFGVERLALLYSITINDPNLEILMRHRAVLFGFLGLLLIYSAFVPSYQILAIVAGLVSALSFIVIAGLTGEYNESIRKVVLADWVAIVALLVACGIRISQS